MAISLELDAVSFSYGENAVVREISASIAAGEFVCLLGPNGTGKTTLVQLIAGELRPARGRVFLNAENAYLANRPAQGVISPICRRTFWTLPLSPEGNWFLWVDSDPNAALDGGLAGTTKMPSRNISPDVTRRTSQIGLSPNSQVVKSSGFGSRSAWPSNGSFSCWTSPCTRWIIR